MLFKPRPRPVGFKGEKFIKLGDKEEVTGYFRGEPYAFKKHWINKQGTECVEGCLICAEGKDEKGPRFTFRINFVVTQDGKLTAKIFEQGGRVYDDLVSLSKKYDLAKFPVEISRHGEEQATRYNFMPRLDTPLTKEIEASLSAVKLLPISTADANSDEVPF